MKQNLGKLDRALRFIAGLALFYFAFANPASVLVIPATALATIVIYESFIGFCGLYSLFHISTLRR